MQAIKLAIILHLEILDLNKKLIEMSDTEVLSKTKMKPFLKKETLELDLENYKEIVQTAKNEFKLLQRLDFTAGLIKNENPIKTSNVKRANRDRDENSGTVTSRTPWGQQSKHYIFSKQNLNCLEIATCRSNVIKASFFAEFQFESQNLTSSKLHSSRFPIEFYSDLEDFYLPGGHPYHESNKQSKKVFP